jgi:RNA polymerase sigma-70 factor (ECF subfamily)
MTASSRSVRGNDRVQFPSDIALQRFQDLMDRRVRNAFRLAGYLFGDSISAEDAVQDAIERAWRSWPKLKDETSFGAWFDRILLNVCRDHARKRRQDRMAQHPSGLADDPFRSIFERDEIGRAMSKLPADQRVVLVLRFWRDLPVDEIADLLDIPAGTVKSRLHYALESLRGELSRGQLLEAQR